MEKKIKRKIVRRFIQWKFLLYAWNSSDFISWRCLPIVRIFFFEGMKRKSVEKVNHEIAIKRMKADVMSFSCFILHSLINFLPRSTLFVNFYAQCMRHGNSCHYIYVLYSMFKIINLRFLITNFAEILIYCRKLWGNSLFNLFLSHFFSPHSSYLSSNVCVRNIIIVSLTIKR